MESRVPRSLGGRRQHCVWLLEHPSIYTAGTSAVKASCRTPDRFPVFQPGAAATSPITAPASASPT